MQQAWLRSKSVEALAAGVETTNIRQESVQKTVCRNSSRCNEIVTPACRFAGHPGVAAESSLPYPTIVFKRGFSR